MKIVVDSAKCKGFAVCTFEAPEVFDLGDDNVAYVIDGSPTERLQREVDQAIRACPAHAISISPT